MTLSKILFTFCLLLIGPICNAYNFDKNWWYDFEGKIGNSDIRLSFFISNSEDSLHGNYCYKKYENKIKLTGRIIGDQIVLTEFINGKPNGHFKGRITSELDSFRGTWHSSSKSKTLIFKLRMESASYGALDHRYDLYGADSDVEEFMKHVKTSIINGDKEWISKHVDYPLETTLDGENPIKIKTKKQLVANFDKIFYQAYKDKIKSYCTCNLFSKDDGVMLGSGLIWINNSPKSNAIIYDFNIIGINNSVEDLKLH